MKKIFLGLILLIFNSTQLYSAAEKQKIFYCFDPSTKFLQAWVRSEEEIATKILKTQNPDWCGAVFNLQQTQILEVPEVVFLKIENELNSYYEKNKNSFFSENKLKATQEITDKLLAENWSIIMDHREMRFKERTLLSEVAINKLIEEKKDKPVDKATLEKHKKEAKLKEENQKKQLFEKQQQEDKKQKQKAEEEKANRLLASMKPEDRRAYICEKTYGLRKGSDKFSECVYKILAADIELEKLELQKKLAEAQLETAKANEAAARANAAASASTRNTPTYDPAIGRAAERANEIETARLAFELARQLNPQRYAPQQQNNIQLPKQQYCKLNPINNRISCYTQ